MPEQERTRYADIVLRGKNGHEKTERAIRSIRENTPPGSYRIILVDDGSDPPYMDTLPDCGDVLVAYPESKGAVSATNLGFAIALDDMVAPFVMVMDNDAWIPDGDHRWLLRFCEELVEIDGTAAVGATTNFANPPQHVLTTPDTYTAKWGDAKKGGLKDNPPAVSLVSFACLIRKDVLAKINGGRWDTQFDPGNYEDTDFAMSCRVAGYQIRIARSVYIHHDGHSTFSDDLRRLLKTNEQKFHAKWGTGRLLDLGFVKPQHMLAALQQAIEQ